MKNPEVSGEQSTAHVRLGVIGLGYVGLPLALAFAEKFLGTVGFDIDENKLEQIRRGEDPCGEGFDQAIRDSSLQVTSCGEDLRDVNVYIVTVPTPIDENNFPDLTALHSACEIVGSVLSIGDTVVFESTVYPGLTEEVCVPLLEKASDLVGGKEFFVGYSPERINPGDKEHTLASIVKVVAGQNEETTDLLEFVYGSVVTAGIVRAPSIRVAEAAKVIENTQRDINIALMNELAIIFDKLELPTHEVLRIAATKWNFLRFTPGLVGGHCIGVDPYYLTAKAQQVGYHPQVILAGRRINDGMGTWVAQRAVKLLANTGRMIRGCRVGVLGLTFKEDICDTRNSRVPDIIKELQEFGVQPLAYDPFASEEVLIREYGVTLTPLEEFSNLDCLILAVPHSAFRNAGYKQLAARLAPDGVFMDLKATFYASEKASSCIYWSM